MSGQNQNIEDWNERLIESHKIAPSQRIDFTMKFITALILTLILSSCVTPNVHGEPESVTSTANEPSLEGIDLYGSNRITLEDIKHFHGELLQNCIDESLRGDDAFAADRQELSQKLIKRYNLAFANLAVIKYFNLHNIPGRQAYATVDVVERADINARMKFLPRPKGRYSDPDGLLKAWDDYQKIGFELLQSGEISGARENCPAFHCIFGHEHPRLAPYKQLFVTGVFKNKAALTKIFLDDAVDQDRANAAFLLAYISDGNELIKILSTRILDENELVRNNVVRVFSDIAFFHKELKLPVDAIIPLLNYPETTDRNKSSMVLFGLVANETQLPSYRPLIMAKAVPTILKLLRLEQPNNHDPAYMILRTLSGKDYGERDYEAWEKWYQSQTKE